MKNLFYAVLMIALFAGCEGKQGAVGPAGPQGSPGAAGAVGPQGPAGQNAVAPKVYDFTVRFGAGQPNTFTYKGITSLGQYDMILCYVTIAKTSTGTVTFRAPMPYQGPIIYDGVTYSPTDLTFYHAQDGTVYVGSFAGSWAAVNLDFRAIVIKGEKGGRIDTERYRNYENLKADYAIKD